MIRIIKGEAPDVLKTRGAAAAAQHCADYLEKAAEYESGAESFEFNRSIYTHSTVREALEKAQHGKCAFCEVVIPAPYADKHIEHWRPKGSAKQAPGAASIRPGYYWLAYDWDNLLLSCGFCNRDNKGTIFPLEAPEARARSHTHDHTGETPLLLKPDDGSDPADHIEFLEELPRPRNGSVIGRTTIEVLGLDRLEHRQRDDLLVSLREAHDQVVTYNGDPHDAARRLVAQGRAFYKDAPKPSSPFSAMAAAFIAANPLPPPLD